MSGIYLIQSKIKPSRIYIGSTKYFLGRKRIHLRQLRKNSHHSHKLQYHYNKYGENDLEFKIITLCPKEDLISNEQFCLDLFRPYFNECKIANSRRGVPVSIETREKQRLAKIGKKHLPMKQETKDKLSQALMGNKNGCGNKNKTRSPDAKEKYKKATLDFFATEKGIKQAHKNSLYNTGVKQTKETIDKRMRKILPIIRSEENRKIKSDKIKAIPPRVCEYCGKLCKFPDYYIHHGNKCKLRK